MSFEDAIMVFKDEKALSLFDKSHSGDEDRWITMGMIPTCNILLVIHTHILKEQKEIIRVISARKATKKEKEQYYERR